MNLNKALLALAMGLALTKIENNKAGEEMRAKRGKKVRPGNKPMTDAEWEIIENAKMSGCIPCIIWAEKGKMPRARVFLVAGWDHSLSGGIRVGHLHGFASCNWHHQGLIIDTGISATETRKLYGPSKVDGSKPFHEAYGSEEALIHRQKVHLGLDTESQGP